MTRRINKDRTLKPWEIDRKKFSSKYTYDQHCAFWALHRHKGHSIPLLAEAFNVHRQVMFKICHPSIKQYFHVLVRANASTPEKMYKEYVTDSYERSVNRAAARRAARAPVPSRVRTRTLDGTAGTGGTSRGQDGATGRVPSAADPPAASR